MPQVKSPLKAGLSWVGNKITWVAVVLFALFMLGAPLAESYQEYQMIKACRAEHHVENCKITTVAVPA